MQRVPSPKLELFVRRDFLTPGEGNPATLHHGMKVRKGVKHVITRWYRERPWG